MKIKVFFSYIFKSMDKLEAISYSSFYIRLAAISFVNQEKKEEEESILVEFFIFIFIFIKKKVELCLTPKYYLAKIYEFLKLVIIHI